MEHLRWITTGFINNYIKNVDKYTHTIETLQFREQACNLLTLAETTESENTLQDCHHALHNLINRTMIYRLHNLKK